MEIRERPSFFLTVPERKPRTLCLCQLVACISSIRLAPSLTFKRAKTRARFVGRIIGSIETALGCEIDIGVVGSRFSLAGREVFSFFIALEALDLESVDLADFEIVSFFEGLIGFMLTFVIGRAP